jgi:hypothetical protein
MRQYIGADHKEICIADAQITMNLAAHASYGIAIAVWFFYLFDQECKATFD